MIAYRLKLSVRAERDRAGIYTWIAKNSSLEIAKAFVDDLLNECESLISAPHRGTLRFMAGRSVRVIGYKRAVTIVFVVQGDTVRILRLLYRGRDVQRASLR